MEKGIKINLTTEERALIINETFADPVLLEPLEKGQVKDDLITVYYAPQDLEELLGFIAADGCLVEHANGHHGLDITSKDRGVTRTN